MAYIVNSTEQVKGIGADYETKAMLYLMSERQDSHEIDSFAIDFYNDVTGLNSHADKAWDMQAKGIKNNSAKSIGRGLVTLYKNYVSDLYFDYMILFLAKIPETFRIDNSINVFGIENIKEKALNSVKKGLTEEANSKNYIQDNQVTDDRIELFLKEITFVIDYKTKAEYIKSILKLNPKNIPNDGILDGIFKKVRDAQSSLKNNTSVEGEIVTKLRDVYNYDTVIYAATDEFHQLFVEGRSGQVTDVCIDALGGAVGVLVMLFILRIDKTYKKL